MLVTPLLLRLLLYVRSRCRKDQVELEMKFFDDYPFRYPILKNLQHLIRNSKDYVFTLCMCNVVLLVRACGCVWCVLLRSPPFIRVVRPRFQYRTGHVSFPLTSVVFFKI